MISKLSAKYQLCAIHTAETIDGKVHRIRESPSFIPARSIGYSVLTVALSTEFTAFMFYRPAWFAASQVWARLFFRGTHA